MRREECPISPSLKIAVVEDDVFFLTNFQMDRTVIVNLS
jgi:hypothetical protein